MSMPPIVDDDTLITLDSSDHAIDPTSPHWSAAMSVLNPARDALSRRTFSGIGEYTSWRKGEIEITLRTEAENDVVLDIRTGGVMLGIVVDDNLVDTKRDEATARDMLDAASTVISRVVLGRGMETEHGDLIALGCAQDVATRDHVAGYSGGRFVLARATSRTGASFLDGRDGWCPVGDADVALLPRNVAVVLVDRMAPLSLGRQSPPMNLHIDLATVSVGNADPMTRLRAAAAWDAFRSTHA